jgi:hypothetical protein
MSDPVLDTLWKKVLADFDDGAAHAAFIEHCRATNQLLEAAVRYRGMAGDHARGPQARDREPRNDSDSGAARLRARRAAAARRLVRRRYGCFAFFPALAAMAERAQVPHPSEGRKPPPCDPATGRRMRIILRNRDSVSGRAKDGPSSSIRGPPCRSETFDDTAQITL